MPLSTDPGITHDELRLAARNHAMPLEALRWSLTPVGMHYLLVHYDVPLVDPAEWRLELSGAVGTSLSLSLDDVRARPAVDVTVTMECAGNGRALLEPRPLSQPWLTEAVGTARWRGVPLADLLHEARPAADVVDVVIGGLDRGVEGGIEQVYARSLPLAEALSSGAVLAYEMNGDPLPAQHGFPLRLVVPGWYGMTNVKWVDSIVLQDEPFDGYQVASAYRVRATEEEAGRPVTRMRPRALMIPPGLPDFFSRERILRQEPTVLAGRAWSGQGEITRVEVSVDGGGSWTDASITREFDDPHAWVGWSIPWQPATTGTHVVCCRATDATGDVQPLEPDWNLGGYENNAVQRVTVHVR